MSVDKLLEQTVKKLPKGKNLADVETEKAREWSEKKEKERKREINRLAAMLMEDIVPWLRKNRRLVTQLVKFNGTIVLHYVYDEGNKHMFRGSKSSRIELKQLSNNEGFCFFFEERSCYTTFFKHTLPVDLTNPQKFAQKLADTLFIRKKSKYIAYIDPKEFYELLLSAVEKCCKENQEKLAE